MEISAVDSLIRTIRRCFNQLKAAGDELHKDLGVNASMRAVMESLDEGGEQTVPQIARAKGVSRQHIQLLADALTRQNLCIFKDNPAHMRSQILALTAQGKSVFGKMRRREKAVLKEIARSLTTKDVETTQHTLLALLETLEPYSHWKDLKND